MFPRRQLSHSKPYNNDQLQHILQAHAIKTRLIDPESGLVEHFWGLMSPFDLAHSFSSVRPSLAMSLTLYNIPNIQYHWCILYLTLL